MKEWEDLRQRISPTRGVLLAREEFSQTGFSPESFRSDIQFPPINYYIKIVARKHGKVYPERVP